MSEQVFVRFDRVVVEPAALQAMVAAAAQKTSPEAVQADHRLIHRAKDVPVDVLSREVDRWMRACSRDGGPGEHQRHRRERSLRIFTGDDGMVHLSGRFDREAGARLRSAVMDASDRCGAPTVAASEPPIRSERPSSDGRMRSSSWSVRDTGGGAGPPEVLERLGCDADITGLLFSGEGKPTWHGPTVRAASPRQWRALLARDQHCTLRHGPDGWRMPALVLPLATSPRSDRPRP